MLDEINKYNELTSYTKWIKAYKDTTIAQEEKEPKKYREYISEKTKWLIDQRDNAQEEGRIEEERSLSKQLRKAAKQDKEDWTNNTIKEAVQEDETWEGMQTINQ